MYLRVNSSILETCHVYDVASIWNNSTEIV